MVQVSYENYDSGVDPHQPYARLLLLQHVLPHQSGRITEVASAALEM